MEPIGTDVAINTFGLAERAVPVHERGLVPCRNPCVERVKLAGHGPGVSSRYHHFDVVNEVEVDADIPADGTEHASESCSPDYFVILV